MQAINEFRSESQKENRLKKNRKEIRHQFTKRLTIEIHPQSSENFPIILDGYTKDISIGGTCVVLDSKDVSVAKSVASFAKTIRNSEVKISFPTEGMELKVSAKIAWTKEIVLPKERIFRSFPRFASHVPGLKVSMSLIHLTSEF